VAKEEVMSFDSEMAKRTLAKELAKIKPCRFAA